MMQKHFMIDIEATGIDPAKEDLLQIGVVQAVFYNGQWVPEGGHWSALQHSGRQPESEFAKTHMADLYGRCNRALSVRPEHLREQLLGFFRSRGATGVHDTYLMGWNASNFDVPFLVHKGVLIPSSYGTDPDGKDVQVGDFHYRIYEMGGAISFAQNMFGASMEREELLRRAREVQTKYRKGPGVPQKEHDAVYDCYEQLDLLNGLLNLVREAR